MGASPAAAKPKEYPPRLDVRYMFDTNIWIDVSHGQIDCVALKREAGGALVVSPLTIVELLVGSVNGSEEQFVRDRRMFRCMFDGDPGIQELPRGFVNRILWNVDLEESAVRPKHYRELLQMLINSATLARFKRNTEAPGSSWSRMAELHSKHKEVLDKELNSLVRFNHGISLKAVPLHFSRMYEFSGLLPDPDVIEQRFSAAMEFLRASVLKVRRGAKPWKNDRGSFVDLRLFFYLADPAVVLVTKEDFSDAVKASPQRTRIISYDAFRNLLVTRQGRNQTGFGEQGDTPRLQTDPLPKS
jgi:hypothetical protein